MFLNRKEYGIIKAVTESGEFTEEQLFIDFINSRVFHGDADRKEIMKPIHLIALQGLTLAGGVGKTLGTWRGSRD